MKNSSSVVVHIPEKQKLNYHGFLLYRNLNTQHIKYLHFFLFKVLFI